MSVDLFTQYPLHLNPSSKAISLPKNSTPQIDTELENLNYLHRGLQTLDPPNIPPPPLPINPKRSAQITKLRDTANTAYRKTQYDEAVRLYSYTIGMALARPGWEPVALAREELGALYANRAQAQMAGQKWPEALLDARCSVECRANGNVKAWWRVAKCLAEMGRCEEAMGVLTEALENEGDGEEGRELKALMEEVEAALKR